ncbi:MAG: transglutaminase domain-containing protein [Alistipes sp.]|nr:transglutaminase domain-containing protein [Alistipes sp.]
MKRALLLFTVALCVMVSSCGGNHFKSINNYLEDFEARRESLSHTHYFDIFQEEMEPMEREAMQFLYAYMPLPDITDYDSEFHLKSVEYALKARREMAWGESVPEREFLHFVLPVRVNNENLDNSRELFFEELKGRVEGLSMYDAALEVNHWCHEKVTYTPSDSRTSSPLASIRTAYGRCGEESTFTVAALRAISIPARQVYTPRWAHTDDNHAWVEVWIDGKWHFLGACEPEPVLDLGWFNAPASRGMLMHTAAFGRYSGPEEVLAATPCDTEINVTSNYAPTATTTVQVVDTEGRPVEAFVEFKIYNYAEFYTAARKICDKNGEAKLTSGCGDLLAWAYKDGKYGFEKLSAGRDERVTIILDKESGSRATIELEITPPDERDTKPQLTDEQIECNAERFAREDSLRNAYVATFPTKEQSEAFAKELSLDKEQVVRVIRESRGNYPCIMQFLSDVEPNSRQRALRLLFELSEKDRRDVELEVLKDHFRAVESSPSDDDTHFRYIFNPRVSNEMLTPYRSLFESVIAESDAERYRNNPQLWVEWCKESITIDRSQNPRRLCMSPKGVWEVRITDPHSLSIFFVSAARAMGIPARIDEITGKTQYLSDGVWHDVEWEQRNARTKPAATGVLRAEYTPSKLIDNPRYYYHFSISKIVDGRAMLLNYPMEATWESLLKGGASLDEGDYMVVSGMRLASGGVLVNIDVIPVKGECTSLMELKMRQSSDKLQVIGSFNSENLFHHIESDSSRSLLSVTGRGYYVIALIDANSEPSIHLLKDLEPYKSEFEKWGQKIVLLFKDKATAERFKSEEFENLPRTVAWGWDLDNDIESEILQNMKLSSSERPILLVADTFNRVVFTSQGYSIGIGEQLKRVIGQLQEE